MPVIIINAWRVSCHCVLSECARPYLTVLVYNDVNRKMRKFGVFSCRKQTQFFWPAFTDLELFCKTTSESKGRYIVVNESIWMDSLYGSIQTDSACFSQRWCEQLIVHQGSTIDWSCMCCVTCVNVPPVVWSLVLLFQAVLNNECCEIDIDVMVQLLAPLLNSQHFLIEELKTAYKSITCQNGFLFVFAEVSLLKCQLFIIVIISNECANRFTDVCVSSGDDLSAIQA